MQSISSLKASWNRAWTIILIAVMLLAITPAIAASANTTGFFSPTRAISHGPGWSNSVYALASDNLYATAKKNNRQLKLTEFYLPAVPGNSVIDGIEVTVEGFTTGPQAEVAVGVSNFSSFKLTTFTGSESKLTLGSPTDTWGKSWTATDFQNKFTVRLTVDATAAGVLSIDQVQVKVYFTPPDTTLVLAPVSGLYNGTTAMTATLTVTANGNPLSGKTLNFSLNGTAMGSAVTNGSGVATLNVNLAGIAAGDYPYGAAVSFAGDPPWDATSITADLRVHGVETTLTVNPVSGPYRGSTGSISATLTQTVGGAPLSGKTINFTLDDSPLGSATTDPSGVASISGVSLTGYDAGMYAGSLQATYAGEFNIEPATGIGNLTVTPLSVTVTGGLIPENKTYDGTTVAILNIGSPVLNGVISPDNATLNTSGATAAFLDKNVGDTKTVQISGLTLDGTEASNYALVQPTRQANITKALLTVTADNMAKFVGASDPAFTFSYSGLATGDTSADVDVAPTCSVSGAHSSVGVFPIVCVGGSDNNYNFTYVNGTLTVSLAHIDIDINGIKRNQTGYDMPVGASDRQSFALNSGPVKTYSPNNAKIIAAERLIYKVGTTKTSFSEMMGLPNKQLDNTYWLPWYNNVDLDTQLRFGNVSEQTATVRIWIGDKEMTRGCVAAPSAAYPYVLTKGQSLRVSCPAVNNGPVKIQSDANIVAAERVIYKVNNVNTSFTEMMALPNSQLDTTYWLPWYNNVDLDTQLRFGNVGDAPTTVRIFIGGKEMLTGCKPATPMTYPYVLTKGQSLRVSCPSVNNGPVEIQSQGPIVAAERVIYKVNNVNTSFTEMMALPNSKLNATYWLPWYNNVDLNTQLRFGNVSDQTATIRIWIGGKEMTSGCVATPSATYPYVLTKGQSLRVSCPNVNSGPVQIVSNVNIVAAERVIYKVGTANTSFSEMMALPDSQLDTAYWMPWYNNVDLDSQLRFGVPMQ